MNYGDIKNAFAHPVNGELRNRTVTAGQVANWVQMSIQRAQSLLEIPSSLKTVVITFGAPGALPVPSDTIRIDNIAYNGVSLYEEKASLVRPLSNIVSGTPRMYCQLAGNIFIAPSPNPGDTIEITYSADFSALAADTDSNWLTNYAPQLIVDGAMVYALRFLKDDVRTAVYEGSFQQKITELNAEADRDRFRNAVMSPGWSHWDES